MPETEIGSDREQRIREVMREHTGDESWDGDLCDEVPGDHKRWLLVENNRGSAASSQPVWLSTHDSPERARAYHDGQEYRADWEPKFLVDLDTRQTHTIETAISFEFDPAIQPEIVKTVPHPVIPTDRACAGCGREIQPGQLYLVQAPFHVGCAKENA